MTETTPNERDILCALVGQVQRAAAGDSEATVTTLVTRPMWALWCKATRMGGVEPETLIPCQFQVNGVTMRPARIFGSRTYIIPGDQLVSVSFKEA